MPQEQSNDYKEIFLELEKCMFLIPSKFEAKLKVAMNNGFPINYECDGVLAYGLYAAVHGTLLHRAAIFGHKNVVEDIGEYDGTNRILVPLNVFRVLIENGADVNLKNKVGVTPYEQAIGGDCTPEILQYMRDAGGKLDSMGYSVLSHLCSNLLEYSVMDMDEELEIQKSELEEQISFIFELGADPYQNNYWTPAYFYSHKYFYKPEYKPSRWDWNDDPGPLYPEAFETAKWIISVARNMLEKAQNIDIEQLNRQTYYELVCQLHDGKEKFIPSLQKALADGFPIDYRPEENVTTILGIATALEQIDPECIAACIEAGANINSPIINNRTPFATMCNNYVESKRSELCDKYKCLAIMLEHAGIE